MVSERYLMFIWTTLTSRSVQFPVLIVVPRVLRIVVCSAMVRQLVADTCDWNRLTFLSGRRSSTL